jgi:putative hydrolase of the HAD superfamily
MAPLVLVDLDNTLLDRERAFTRWARAFVGAHGLGPDAVPVLVRADADGSAPRDHFFATVRRELGVTAPVDDLLADYHVSYPSTFTADPAMVVAVRSLRTAGCAVAVVTNGPPSQATKLVAAGIEDEFDAVCISSLVGASKPERVIFEEAARRCGRPLDGWMVGDSPDADVAGGIAAGLRTIWIHRGREWDHPAFTPDVTVSSVPEAAAVILGDR